LLQFRILGLGQLFPSINYAHNLGHIPNVIGDASGHRRDDAKRLALHSFENLCAPPPTWPMLLTPPQMRVNAHKNK